jgi:hypothetical protein
MVLGDWWKIDQANAHDWLLLASLDIPLHLPPSRSMPVTGGRRWASGRQATRRRSSAAVWCRAGAPGDGIVAAAWGINRSVMTSSRFVPAIQLLGFLGRPFAIAQITKAEGTK